MRRRAATIEPSAQGCIDFVRQDGLAALRQHYVDSDEVLVPRGRRLSQPAQRRHPPIGFVRTPHAEYASGAAIGFELADFVAAIAQGGCVGLGHGVPA